MINKRYSALFGLCLVGFFAGNIQAQERYSEQQYKQDQRYWQQEGREKLRTILEEQMPHVQERRRQASQEYFTTAFDNPEVKNWLQTHRVSSEQVAEAQQRALGAHVEQEKLRNPASLLARCYSDIVSYRHHQQREECPRAREILRQLQENQFSLVDTQEN